MPLPRLNLNEVRQLFRPTRIAQRIETAPNYGTPVLDRYFPENTRRPWDEVLVPIEEVQRVTRGVPVVLRGAPGVTTTPAPHTVKWIEPQPIKTIDGFTAVAYNNARLLGGEAPQNLADRLIDAQIGIHRNSTEALAAQALSGSIVYPIAGGSGNQIIGLYEIQFGTPGTIDVGASWLLESTTIGNIHEDLEKARKHLARKSFNLDRVDVGSAIYAAVLNKVIAAGAGEGRFPARLREDGGIQIGKYVLTAFDGEYYHPGTPDGSVEAGYVSAIGANEVIATDSRAPWTLLRVRIDNFKGEPTPVPLHTIQELSKDGSQIELFFESKPLPLPPVPAIVRFDAAPEAEEPEEG